MRATPVYRSGLLTRACDPRLLLGQDDLHRRRIVGGRDGVAQETHRAHHRARPPHLAREVTRVAHLRAALAQLSIHLSLTATVVCCVG